MPPRRATRARPRWRERCSRAKCFEAALWGGKNMFEQLLNGASASGDAEIIRMVLERIDWPRGDGRWFYYLWNSLQRWPEGRYLDCFRLILDRSGPECPTGPREDHSPRSDRRCRTRRWAGPGNDAPRRRSAYRCSRQSFQEHSARLGVPLGPEANREANPRTWC
jgi:hypothetical protein